MPWKQATLIVLIAVLYTAARGEDTTDTTTTSAEIAAPFGLKWGQALKKKECLKTVVTEDSIVVCEVSKVPKPVSGYESYRLIYIRGEMYKAVAIGKDVTGDPYGIDIREKYDKIKEALTTKYDMSLQPRSVEYIGEKVFREEDEYYECLRYEGCGNWSTFWGNAAVDGVGISLEVKGLRRGTGYLVLTYEHKKFGSYLDYIQGLKDIADNEGL